MSAWIVDASVGLKWCIAEVDSAQAERVLRSLAHGNELMVPDLFFVECANALWKRVRRAEISAEDAQRKMADLLGLPLRVAPLRELTTPALAVAIACDATVYDACYVALAEREGATLITADERLVGKTTGRPCKTRVLSALTDQDFGP